jgi:hypothetical protein
MKVPKGAIRQILEVETLRADERRITGFLIRPSRQEDKAFVESLRGRLRPSGMKS